MVKKYEDIEKFLESLDKREAGFKEILSRCDCIVSAVQDRGEEALLQYIREFDGLRAGCVGELLVGDDEFGEALASVDKGFVESMRKAVANVEAFHREQKKRIRGFSIEKQGLITGEKIIPVQCAGVYVPGGKGAYPSSVIMNVIPARVAGVPEITAATPPGDDGRVNRFTLAAFALSGIKKVYKMGGAQAIAAMAFGVGMPRAQKIAGPGNAYVSAAKLLVQQKTNVGIDSVAGPTEVVIIADGNANPGFIAADLLSQAEHGGDSMPILITTSAGVADRTLAAIHKQLECSPRARIIAECLKANAAFVIVKSMKEAVELSDLIAPEHLGLHVREPWRLFELIRNAGAVFLGGYSPESAGDYFAGPNHVLPTAGRAVFASALGVNDFLKRVNFVCSDEVWLGKAARHIIKIAEAEGFHAHAEAVRLRTDKKKGKRI